MIDDILEEALNNGYEYSAKRFNIEISKVKEIVLNFKIENLNEDEVCKCECHKLGITCMHFMPCCNLCYKKYINKDGNINKEFYKKVLR